MAKKSAGVLLYRLTNGVLEIMLVHPGGPFWKNKDLESWSIPKGEFTEEEAFSAARREFLEETGIELSGNFIELSPIKQKSGKLVYGWALEKDIDPGFIRSNTFELEWPPKSGNVQQYPEIDKGEWYDVPEGLKKINKYQGAFVEELIIKLNLKPEQTAALQSKKRSNDSSQLNLF